MASTTTRFNIDWTRLDPKPDPAYGKPCARSSHGLSIVQNGTRLVLYGGEHIARTPIEDEENFWIADKTDDSSWQWRCIRKKDNESRPPIRVAHAQAVYEDKYMYIFGGRAGITMQEQAMNDLWKVDVSGPPGTEQWTQVTTSSAGEPPEPRSFHKMICVGSCLYVFGGCTASHGRAADLHKYDITSNTWHTLPASTLRGRGGPNFFPLDGGQKLAVVAGFCGEESCDGQIFNCSSETWNEQLLSANETFQGKMRPRSVCVSGSFPYKGLSLIFGGEVDPSERGHEGAGAFENDVVLLSEKDASLLEIQTKTTVNNNNSGNNWPHIRGWSDATTYEDTSNGVASFFIFGGLAGDDKSPERLDDLWKLDIH